MSDNLKNPITLAGELLLLRMFDDDEKADETIRQSAIRLRQLFEEVKRLRFALAQEEWRHEPELVEENVKLKARLNRLVGRVKDIRAGLDHIIHREQGNPFESAMHLHDEATKAIAEAQEDGDE